MNITVYLGATSVDNDELNNAAVELGKCVDWSRID